MINLLCELLELPDPVVSVGSTVWTKNRVAIDQLSRLGALTQSDAVRTIPCPACDEHHYVRVECTEAGAFRAYCYNEGYLPIDAADLTVLEVDIRWMIDALREGINVLSRPAAEELVPDHLWFLGEQRIKAYRTRFYFGWRLTDLACIEQVGAALAAKPATMPGLLLTSSSCAPLASRLPKRHDTIFLADACRATNAMQVDEEILLAALRADDRVVVGSGGVGYVLSEGFRSAVVGNKSYTFSKKQAAVIEALYDGYHSGLERIHQDTAVAAAGSNQRIIQIFDTNKEAYEHLIGSDGHGYYWLKI